MTPKGLTFLLLLLLMVGAVVASADPLWMNYQHSGDNAGQTEAARGDWENFTNRAPQSVSFPIGDTSQPLVGDVDNDGTQEFFVTGQNYVDLIHINSSISTTSVITTNIIAEHNNRGVNQVQPALWKNPVDGKTSWVTIVNNTIQAYRYTDETPLAFSFTASFPPTVLKGCTVWDGIKCSQSSNNCYALCENKSLGGLLAYKFAMTTNTTTTSNITFALLRNTSVGQITQPFALGDINNDGTEDLVFGCDANQNGIFGVCVIDSGSMNYNSYFNGNGVFDDLTRSFNSEAPGTYYGGEFITSPVIANLDTIGDSEIIVGRIAAANSLSGACTEGQINAIGMTALRASGSVYWNTTFVNALNKYFGCNGITLGEQHPSQPFISTMNNTLEVCMSHNHAFSGGNRSDGCVLGTTGAVRLTKNGTGQAIPIYASSGLSFLRNATTHDDYVLLGQFLYSVNQTGQFGVMNQIGTVDSFDSTGSSIASDVTNDGNIDLINAINSQTTVAYLQSSATVTNDSLPVLNTSMRNGGYYGWFNGPICKGTTQTYRATKCPGTGSGCNYNNDLGSNAERLTTNCGTGTTTQGAFNLTTPAVSCLYNNTGTFSVTIYLQESTHAQDLSQFNPDPIIVNVIDGVPGSTCNIPSSFVATPGAVGNTQSQTAQQQQIDNNIASVTDLILGSTFTLKFLVGLILAVLFAAGAVNLIYGRAEQRSAGTHISPVMVLIFFVIGLAIVTLFGMIPPYILLFLLIAMALVMMLAKFVVTGREPG